MVDCKETVQGSFRIFQGTLGEHQVVLGLCGVGVIGAASLTTLLILKFQVTHLILCGVGGALQAQLKIGDVVIGTGVLNYDLNCTAFDQKLQRGQDPFTKVSLIPCDTSWIERKGGMNCHLGKVLCTQEFLSQTRKVEVTKECRDFLVVDMEGSGVAQVAWNYKIPFLILRGISDTYTPHPVESGSGSGSESTAQQFKKSLTMAIQKVSETTFSILKLFNHNINS